LGVRAGLAVVLSYWLANHVQIPLTVNAMFPKLSCESAYSLMALLGAKCKHNDTQLYIHLDASLAGTPRCIATGLS
jgi:ethylene-insensitive protein 2